MPSIPPTPSKLDQILKGLSIPVALSLAATLFSGNTVNLLNDWDWLNGSFNRITQILPGSEEAPAGEPEDASPAEPFVPAISIQVNPNIVVNPADLNAWQQVVTGHAPAIDFHPDLDNSSQANPVINNSNDLDLTLPPIDIDQWMQPQGQYPGLGLQVFSSKAGPTTQIFPRNIAHLWSSGAWSTPPNVSGLHWTTAIHSPSPAKPSLPPPSAPSALAATTCLPSVDVGSRIPTAIPEAGMIWGLSSVVGLTLLGKMARAS
jgi:hypothetical protein